MNTTAIPAGLGGHDSPQAQRELTQHLSVVDYHTRDAEIAATRLIKEAIKALPDWANTPAAIGHVCAVLSAKVGQSGWKHLEYAEEAQEVLDNLSDSLSAAEEQS